MNIFLQIIIVILLGITLYYIVQFIMLLFCNKSLFCAKHTIGYMSKETERAYYNTLKLIDSGATISIYSNEYFCLCGIAEKYRTGELRGYYFLVFSDGDVALYNEQGEILMTSVWKPLLRDLVSRAGHSDDDIKLCRTISNYYYKHGAIEFIKKFYTHNV